MNIFFLLLDFTPFVRYNNYEVSKKGFPSEVRVRIMFEVRSDNLRFIYTFFDTIQEKCNPEEVIRLKRQIRQLNKKQILRKIIKDYGIDGYTELIELPHNLNTYSEAEEFFKRNYFLRIRNSLYDCTGQAFTSWYKIFNRHNHFYAYHYVGIDV